MNLVEYKGMLNHGMVSQVCPLLEENLKEFINPSIDGDVPGEPVALVRALSWGSDSDAQSIHSELLMSLQTSGGPRFLTHIICSDLVSGMIHSMS